MDATASRRAVGRFTISTWSILIYSISMRGLPAGIGIIPAAAASGTVWTKGAAATTTTRYTRCILGNNRTLNKLSLWLPLVKKSSICNGLSISRNRH